MSDRYDVLVAELRQIERDAEGILSECDAKQRVADEHIAALKAMGLEPFAGYGLSAPEPPDFRGSMLARDNSPRQMARAAFNRWLESGPLHPYRSAQ